MSKIEDKNLFNVSQINRRYITWYILDNELQKKERVRLCVSVCQQQ